ncbi:MAG: hypothetical protein LBB53_00075 [Prevotellaceae bacterium]|nr:hypothetical protein [Prevotellaceae bacterium]
MTLDEYNSSRQQQQQHLVSIADIPLLRYLKEPVHNINDLYVRYPDGGQYGWFAHVMDIGRFAYWDTENSRWNYINSVNVNEIPPELIANDLTTIEEGKVLDARQGAALKQLLNSNQLGILQRIPLSGTMLNHPVTGLIEMSNQLHDSVGVVNFEVGSVLFDQTANTPRLKIQSNGKLDILTDSTFHIYTEGGINIDALDININSLLDINITSLAGIGISAADGIHHYVGDNSGYGFNESVGFYVYNNYLDSRFETGADFYLSCGNNYIQLYDENSGNPFHLQAGGTNLNIDGRSGEWVLYMKGFDGIFFNQDLQAEVDGSFKLSASDITLNSENINFGAIPEANSAAFLIGMDADGNLCKIEQ